jgi:16S rRNA (guanine527-N7)-methyltransferase
LNLSALRTPEACYHGNVLDSLPILDLPEFQGAKTVLDVGTGGGFPLLPIALVRPDIQVTGLDATQKKIDAIGRIGASLGLPNLHLLCGRAEDLGHDPTHRERYDCVTARAVAQLPTLLELTAPFARPGGIIVLWKSLHIDEELNASLFARSTLSTHLLYAHRYTLPGDWGERQLLVFAKSAKLKPIFPRENGLPKNVPLLSEKDVR